MQIFVYGTLCYPPLLQAVLGHAARSLPAVLPDHAVYWARGGAFPLIVRQPGGQAAGLLLCDLTSADVARLDFYEGGFGYDLADVTVRVMTGAAPTAIPSLAASASVDCPARAYLPRPGAWQPEAPWALDAWVARYGAAAVATALDFMDHLGEVPAARLAPRYGQMLVRGASRLRAAAPGATRLRRATEPGDVQIAARRHPYAAFFAVEEYDLRHRRFDGSMGETVTRAAFVSGDAVTVLPYDPARDRVLLVEQFRTGPLARGDAQLWQLEPVAGRIDPGETPDEAARREAVEEANLTLGALHPVAGFYPSPGMVSEYIYAYLAIADLPDGCTGVFGAAEEAEDIRGHLLSFAALMDLLASGEAANAPLILTALWLQRERARLRATATG